MITGVKILQYHLTKLEDAEKELAEVLNSGYTLLSCACSDTYAVWTLTRKEEPAWILVPNPKIISEVDDYPQDGLPEGWEVWEGGENPAPGKWVKYKLRMMLLQSLTIFYIMRYHMYLTTYNDKRSKGKGK